jgi:hypothetical protein
LQVGGGEVLDQESREKLRDSAFEMDGKIRATGAEVARYT